jgi:hypothetical protein
MACGSMVTLLNTGLIHIIGIFLIIHILYRNSLYYLSDVCSKINNQGSPMDGLCRYYLDSNGLWQSIQLSPVFIQYEGDFLNYNQALLNNLELANDIGEKLGLLARFIRNKILLWGIIVTGSLSISFIYGLIWLVLNDRISALPCWVMGLALFLGANSETWFNTVFLVTNM